MVIDFHIHTVYSSDSCLEIKKVLQRAKKAGLNGIAITDHNTIQGALEAQRYQEAAFIVIVGCEVSTEVGDITGLFLKEEIASHKAREVMAEIKAQGGLVVLPHPFHGHRWELMDEEMLKGIDLVEAFNSRGAPGEDAKARDFALRRGLPIIAGSDAHFLSEIGKGVTHFDTPLPPGGLIEMVSASQRTLSGNYSPAYYAVLSRLVKGVRQKGLWHLPAELGYLSYKSARALARKMRHP